MSIVRIILSFAIILSFGISAFGQGDYLKYGETGLDINAMLQIDDDGVGNFGGNTGISLKGVVDLSFSVLATQKTSYALGIALNPLKQEGTGSPVGLLFSYSIASTTIDNLLSDNAYAFGPTVFSNIRFKPNMTFQPAIAYLRYGANQSGAFGSRKQDGSLGFGLSLFYDLKSGESLKFETAYVQYDSHFSIGISIGILLREDK